MELTEQSTEIQEITTQTGDIMATAKGIVVTDDPQMAAASNVLKTISDAKKQIEGKRKFFVEPLNEQVKKINALFKSIVAPLDVADEMIRGKILDYRKKQAAELAKEQERLNKEAIKEQKKVDAKAERMGVESTTVVPKTVAPAASMVGAATVKKVWKFKVTDPAIVPRDYLMVDETKIRNAVREGVRAIQGVEIYQDDQLSIGGRG